MGCFLYYRSAPLEDCRYINDDLAAIEKRIPKRFVGLAEQRIRSFSELKIVMAHFGGGIAALKDRRRLDLTQKQAILGDTAAGLLTI